MNWRIGLPRVGGGSIVARGQPSAYSDDNPFARTKFQFNDIHAFLDRAPVGESDANILAARAQVDF